MPGLGKGLSSLIPENLKKSALAAGFSRTVVAELPGDKVRQIPVDQIESNRYQPRQSFGHTEIEELAKSIKRHGILQPLIVTQTGPNKYELIAGERRLRAAQIVEFKTVPAIIREAKDQERLELALIENIQRQDLNLLEEALAYQRLIEEFSLSHEEVAQRVGKSRPVISNALRVLGLPEEIQQAIIDRKITGTHARAIAALVEEKDQLDLFHRIIAEHLNAREVEEEAKRLVAIKHIRAVNFDPIVQDMVDNLRTALGTKVAIKKRGERGTIVINFYSEEELNNIIKKITNV